MTVVDVISRCLRTVLILAGCVLFSIEPIAAEEVGIEELAQVCAGCHGEKGIPQEKTTPIIWGQNEGYMYLQLRDFQKGTRKDPNMTEIVKDLSRDQVRALAKHFSKLPWPVLNQPAPNAKVTQTAMKSITAVACFACHQGEYEGDGTTGRLAGQQKEYLAKTINDFRSRKRGNNPGMSDMMKTLKDDEVEALAAYLASLMVDPGSVSH